MDFFANQSVKKVAEEELLVFVVIQEIFALFKMIVSRFDAKVDIVPEAQVRFGQLDPATQVLEKMKEGKIVLVKQE